MADDFDIFEGLDEFGLPVGEGVAAPAADPDAQYRNNFDYRCLKCTGTGQYLGVRIHQPASECFHCKGRGWFKTTVEQRQKASMSAHARREAVLAENRADNIADIGQEAYDWLRTQAVSGFVGDVLRKHDEGVRLSEKQVLGLLKWRAGVTAARERREADAPAVDLTGIFDMFETAQGNGLSRPIYRALGLTISKAPTSGVNAGALYVKDVNKNYLGKVKDGKFFGRAEGVAEQLREIAAAPLSVAISYGRETGSCACCGRTLTDPKSIELGIGPVCKDKWGF